MAVLLRPEIRRSGESDWVFVTGRYVLGIYLDAATGGENRTLFPVPLAFCFTYFHIFNLTRCDESMGVSHVPVIPSFPPVFLFPSLTTRSPPLHR